MAVGFSNTNKPINPRGNDASPKGYNRASLFSGKALDFDGVNDLITTTYTSGFTGAQEFTYCVYINANTNQQSQAIVHGNENVGWGLQSLHVRTETNGIRFFAGTGSSDTSYVDSEVIEENKWYFVVGTHTPTENKIYLNGVLNATATAGNLIAAPQAITIGAYPSSVQLFNGEISGVRVFNTALTAAQVADLYNNPEKVVPTGVDNTALKLWLPMQEGAGTTAYDGSGNGNHGTISGATYVHGIGAPVSQTAVIDWNKLYEFDGVDDSFTTGTYQALGDRTITLSFYSSDYSRTGSYPNTLFAFNTAGGGNTDMVRISTDGYVGVYDGAVLLGTPTIQVNENELTHIAIVTDAGTETKVYVNGELSYSYNAWSPSVGSTDIFNIGQETDGVNISDLWRGFIFNVGVFDSVLTQSEIQAIQGKRYADLTSAQKTNLVSFYSLQNDLNDLHGSKNLTSTGSPSALLIPQGLTSGRDLLGNLFENVRKQGALNLDGNSWAEVHDNASLDVTTGLTLESWVYFDGSTNTAGILDKYHYSVNKRSYDLRRDTSGNVQFTISSNGADNLFLSYTGSQISTGWHHVLATYDQVNQKLYVDGVLNNSASATISIYNSDKPVTIGVLDPAVSSSIFNSPIAQPRIYNRALTAAEVLRNYNSGKNTYTND